MANLDFYLRENGRIEYSKDLSIVQYSTDNTVRLYTKTPYDIVEVNLTTGQNLNTYKKALVLDYNKVDGYYVYSVKLGKEATWFQFPGDKTIDKLAFYLYKDAENLSNVLTTTTAYIPVLKSVEGMPDDGSITDEERAEILAKLNRLEETIADLDVGSIDTAKYYEKPNGTRLSIHETFEGVKTDINNNITKIDSLTAKSGELENKIGVNANDIKDAKEAISRLQQFEGSVNLGNYYTKTETRDYVDSSITNLVNSAPETLDTLGEIATALQNNQSVVQALNTSIATKADKNEVYTKTEVDNAIKNIDVRDIVDDLIDNDTFSNKLNEKIDKGSLKTLNSESLEGEGNIVIPLVSANDVAAAESQEPLETLTITDPDGAKVFRFNEEFITFSNVPASNAKDLRTIQVGDDVWNIAGSVEDIDLSNYYTKGEVNVIKNELTESINNVAADAEQALQNTSTLVNYDTKTEVNAKIAQVKREILTGASTEELNEAYDTILEISKYIEEDKSGAAALTAKVNSNTDDIRVLQEAGYITNAALNGYATEQWVENKNYLTQHQSLDNYYTKGDIDVKVNDINTSISGLEASVDQTYATKELANSKVDQTAYDRKVSEIENSITGNTNDINNLENGISELDNRLDTVESNIGTGGTIDNRIQAAVSGANSYTDTKVNDEKTARETADNNLSNRLNTIEGDYLTSSDVVGNNGEAVGETLTSLKIGNKNYNVEVLGAEFVFSNEALSGAQDLRTLVVNGDRWNFKVDPAEFNEFKETVLADIEAYKAELKAYADQKVADIVGQAPEAYDTLKEISDYISEDTSNAASMLASIQENTTTITTKANIGDSYTKAESDGKYQLSTTAYNKSNIVYSTTEPTNPVEGMIWLKPVN